MNTTNKIKQHKKAIHCLEMISHWQERIDDMRKRIIIEENKPYHLSYLYANRTWYEDQIKSSYHEINKIQKRYEKITFN